VSTGLDWADYVAGRPERLPRGGGETWGDVAPTEYRRVTRNYQRWRERRLRWQTGRPITFVLKGDAVIVEQYPGRTR
jgi:hypothetical protein